MLRILSLAVLGLVLTAGVTFAVAQTGDDGAGAGSSDAMAAGAGSGTPRPGAGLQGSGSSHSGSIGGGHADARSAPLIEDPVTVIEADVLDLLGGRDIAVLAFRALEPLTFALTASLTMEAETDEATCILSMGATPAPVDAILAALEGDEVERPAFTGGSGMGFGGVGGGNVATVAGQAIAYPPGATSIAQEDMQYGSLGAGEWLLFQGGISGASPQEGSAWPLLLEADGRMEMVRLPNGAFRCGSFDSLEGATLSASNVHVGGSVKVEAPYALSAWVREFPAWGHDLIPPDVPAGVGRAVLTTPEGQRELAPGTCVMENAWGSGAGSLAVDHWASRHAPMWMLAAVWTPGSFMPC